MPIQLKILTPVGTAMIAVVTPKAVLATGPSPAANMWWAHTPNPMKPIAIPENTTNWYPNRGFREKTGRTSEKMPNAGRIST